jgi:hypothetical protein
MVRYVRCFLLIQNAFSMKYKTRDPIVHTPTTKEVFYCLSRQIEWCRILAQESTGKPYHDFLIWLISQGFYESDANRITVVKLSKNFNKPSTKITQWITQIYNDIFELNETSPNLFQKDGVKVSMYFTNYDSFTGLDISVMCIPREHEQVIFPFVKAKVGTDHFYVDKVRHEFGSTYTVEIWVKGGFFNFYREYILDKAEFQGRIGWMDLHHQQPYEIDERLNKIYPH